MNRHALAVLVAAVAAAVGTTSGAVTAPRDGVDPKAAAAAAYARLTPAQRVGELFMTAIASTGATPAALRRLRKLRIGNLILDGDSTKGRHAVHQVTSAATRSLSVKRVQPFIATDQEGGEVQRLTGHGFDPMPTALRQGRLSAAVLKAASTTWGSELVDAGVDLDLAPVADTVPAEHAKANQPIGRYDREFGHTPGVVARHVVAFVDGLTAAGADVTVKHFPGLGRATGNTDTSRHVTDPTTRHDRFLAPYRAGIKAGAQFVMVSSATYPNIDPGRPACFSPTIIAAMLRGDEHFQGVVVSDDLGTAALARFPTAKRATAFFAAGGTMLLDTTPADMAPMIKAVRTKANADQAFAKQLQTDEMTVLLAKANAGLIAS